MRRRFTLGYALIGALLLVVSLGVTACGSASTVQTGQVNVALHDSQIDSSLATFVPGMRYHFTVVNRGSVSHEMMIMPQGMSQMPMDQMDHIALARTGDIPPGATKTVDFTFTPAMSQQHLEFGCYYQGHYESGMHLPITVKQTG
jgi:uncharacterized cupredoxin-like copper-binding protein